MKFLFLGTGTSHGVPIIACNCKICRSHNKKNKRFRSSVYVTTDDNHHILVDVTPEFRMQFIKHKIFHLDEVLLTHSHADHLHGIDDLRIFSSETPDSTKNNKENQLPIPIYSNKKTCQDLKERFSYLFVPPKEGGGHAKIKLNEVENQFNLGKTIITPIPMMHGHMQTTGWMFTEERGDGSPGNPKERVSIAYLTDCNYLSDQAFELIKKNCGTLKHLIIDGLRIKPHSTHFNYLEAMQAAQTIGCAQNVWLTHMTHQVGHKETKKYIKEHIKEFPGLKGCKVRPAYDGLELKI